MKHLIISRELPPATYPAGGIGTYVANIARLLVEKGDTLHLIGERWRGAPLKREALEDGRLIIHRIGKEDLPHPCAGNDADRLRRELTGLKSSSFPAQWFAWSAAFLAEQLVRDEGIETIEAQEWEAPLYYYLLRRSLGLGPEGRVPCIIHLHSPTVFIHRFNGPAIPPPAFDAMRRMEEFCIRSADALVCPSRSLAAQASRHYGVAREWIETIPLPVGFTPRIARDPVIWEQGSICFVGRLEPRKGVIEWVEAAIRVARRRPEVHFDFIGADIWGLQNAFLEQIGKELAPRFRFHGAKAKADIVNFLSRASAAVVPSRWENFPNVCIEAMSSGLPVIATRFGGMNEMIDDGRTGWLAEDNGIGGLTDSLVDALNRCLDTSPAEKAEMGSRAADAVRQFCDNAVIGEAHQRLRADASQRTVVATTTGDGADAMPIYVVIRTPTIEDCELLLRSLNDQTLLPSAIVVVHQQLENPERLQQLQSGSPIEVHFQHLPLASGPRAWNLGMASLDAMPAEALYLFLDHHDELATHALADIALVFAKRLDVGIVSPWTEKADGAEIDAFPSPTAIDQMIQNEVAMASAFRGKALPVDGPFRPGLPRGHDIWALANEVIAAGWTAVTFPALLARRNAQSTITSWPQDTALRAIRTEVLSAFAGSGNRPVLDIVDRYVPSKQRLHSGPAVSDKPLRRLALRAIEASLLYPRATAHRCLASAKHRLFR